MSLSLEPGAAERGDASSLRRAGARLAARPPQPSGTAGLMLRGGGRLETSCLAGGLELSWVRLCKGRFLKIGDKALFGWKGFLGVFPLGQV